MKPLHHIICGLAIGIACQLRLEAQNQVATPLNLKEVSSLMQWPSQYPANFDMGHIACGWTVVKVLVSKEGEYIKHELVSSDDNAIADSVQKQVHLLRFSPATENHQPIESWVELTIYLQNPKDFVEPAAPKPLNLQAVKDSIRTRVGPLHDMRHKVVAKVLVGIDGIPQEVIIAKSSHEKLSQIVSEEAKRLRFEPGVLCGRVCEQWCMIPFILE